MRVHRPAALALLIAVPATFLDGGARAEDLVLRLAVPVGAVIAFDETSTIELAMKLGVLGQSIDISQEIDTHTLGTTEILEVDAEGAPVKVDVAFDPTSSMSVEVNGEAQDQPFPFAGQTLTVTLDEGKVSVEPDPGNLDDGSREELATYLDLTRAYLPGAPVPVGGTWTGALPLGGGGQTTFTLVGLSERDGRRIADTTFVSSLAGPMQGMTMDGEGRGTAAFDVATGTLAQMSFNGEASLSGQTEAQGMKADVEGTITITGEVTNRLAAPGGGSANAPVANAAPAAEGAALATASSSATPPFPVNPDRRFVVDATTETFADASITLRMTGDDIVVERDGQSYPGRIGKRDGDVWEGTFDAAGTSFPLKATKTGTGLKLESGGATYELTPKPANPLGG